MFRQGISYADAAAKEGRLLHPRDQDLEKEIVRCFFLVSMVAKFAARISAVTLAARDDTPPFDASRAVFREKRSRTRTALLRHAPVPEGIRV